MEKILICSDFDGTVGGSSERLAHDLEMIEKLRTAGHLFGLVSGRNAAGLRWVREKYAIPVDFLMSSSGGSCHIDGELLFSVDAGAALVYPLAEFLMKRGSGMVVVNHADGADFLYYRHSDGREDWLMPRSKWQDLARPFPQVSGYFKDYSACRAVGDEIERLFPTLTALPNDDCLDIVPKGSNKAVGIARLAMYYGIKKENIFTVGDNFNDLHMLDSYNSFVVENAPDEVKKHATVGITPSVGNMIEQILKTRCSG